MPRHSRSRSRSNSRNYRSRDNDRHRRDEDDDGDNQHGDSDLCRLHIGDLTDKVSQSEIEKSFTKFGEVCWVRSSKDLNIIHFSLSIFIYIYLRSKRSGWPRIRHVLPLSFSKQKTTRPRPSRKWTVVRLAAVAYVSHRPCLECVVDARGAMNPIQDVISAARRVTFHVTVDLTVTVAVGVDIPGMNKTR